MRHQKWLYRLFMLACLCVMGISSYHLYREWKEAQNSQSLYADLQEQAISPVAQEPTDEPSQSVAAYMGNQDEPEQEADIEPAPITVDFDMLHEENADIIAWLYCPDTSINYPVVQSSDNDYYLRRLLDGNYNTAGTLFADYRNAGDFSDWTSLIYGHNMKNDTMFGTLPDYREQGYFEEHPVMYLLTPTQNYMVELFAGYVTSTSDSIYQVIDSKDKRDAILKRVLEQSDFTSLVEIADNDHLLILSTCAYEYENARYVVLGKLKEIG